MPTQVPISIDDILQSTAIGSLDKAIGNNLFGFNHQQTPSAVPSNLEQQGYVFVVRPQLNLQLDNVRNVRKLMALASDSSNTSIHRFIRTTLDPRLQLGYQFGKTNIKSIESPLTNNQHGFIPVLTNNVLSVRGWPDLTVPLFTSKPGRYNEQYQMVDGLVENFEPYTVDMELRNTHMDPILYLFYVWTLYMSYVFNGKCVPYPDFIVQNRLDYTTRIFRIRLDRNRHKVTKIMSTGPAIPIACSVGQFADLEMDDIFSKKNKEISMRFACAGFEIFDEILIYEFNTIVQIFKTAMNQEHRDTHMVLVPRTLTQLFQHRAYPRINPETHAMEWWVDRDLFDKRTVAFLQALQDTEDIEAAKQAANNNRTIVGVDGLAIVRDDLEIAVPDEVLKKQGYTFDESDREEEPE